MADAVIHGVTLQQEALLNFGLTTHVVRKSIEYTHRVLDLLDKTLVDSGGVRLSSLIELANLSAIIGNVFRSGVAIASDGAFAANKPHTYPDLLAIAPGTSDIEIKVALERNNPKGHLIKPGPHLCVRYVLADEDGTYKPGSANRGDVPWIWEVRVGHLEEMHFNFSNTEGDSGKTAVINASGMDALAPVFIDLARCPHSQNGKIYATLATQYDRKDVQPGHLRQLPSP